MSTTITPTVGRVVWFYVALNGMASGFSTPDEGQPLAAIVARVWNDRMVNLTVFDANGTPHSRTSVPLVQEGEDVPANGFYAAWMPYQIGQAKKAEDREHDAKHIAGTVAPTLNTQPAPGAAHAGYSTMQPHQQRVVDERADLDARLAKLGAFFETPIFSSLDADEQWRLRQQHDAMAAYSGILSMRITAFARAHQPQHRPERAT